MKHAIAIDGPAASGKSTLAMGLAKRLGLVMVNSGAMYRAITWKVLSAKIDPTDQAAVVSLLEKIDIQCGHNGHNGHTSTITIDGTDPEKFLRQPEINTNVSTVSAIPQVREKLVALQREYLKHTHIVMEGRDIGSVVFPDTPFKIYIDADPKVRNTRRSDAGEVDSVAKRDAADTSRSTAPLTIAKGAVVLDTSNLSIGGVEEAAIQILRKQGFPMPQTTHPEPENPAPMRWIYWIGWLLFGSAYRTIFGLRIIGRENLITSGPVLIASNHQSYLDPPLIGNLYQTEMVFLARKTLFKGFFKWLYKQWNAIPVDQERPDMTSLKTIIRKLKDGHRVLVFPEGERSRDGTIGNAAPGIGLIAAKAGVPVQPIRISGADQALRRGSSRIQFSRITVSVGQPIILSPAELKASSGKEGYDALAKRIMAAIRDL